MGDSSWHRLVTCPAMVLLLLSETAIAGDLQQQIDACADIGDDEGRLACFDALVSTKDSGHEPAVAEPAAAPKATPPAPAGATTAASTTAEAQVKSPPIIAPASAGDEAKEKDVFNVRLTKCTQSAVSGRQVYYLDNGEVWRQSKNRRNNVRDCDDTAVTIEKDVFGYKMHVPSENRSIRITPLR